MARRGPTQTFFDLWSRTYDNRLLQAVTYRPVQDAVVAALGEQRPSRVLDVGCGTGQLTTRIADELGAVAVGADFSPGMLGRAHERHPGGSWVQADAMRLPVGVATVDAVVCTESFHWYPDQSRAMAEFARVLRPGGRVYLALVNPPREGLSEMTARMSRRVWQPFYWPTPQRMRAMAAAAGLRVLRQQRIARLPSVIVFPAVLTVAERSVD